jgi:hypothetical protein
MIKFQKIIIKNNIVLFKVFPLSFNNALTDVNKEID